MTTLWQRIKDFFRRLFGGKSPDAQTLVVTVRKKDPEVKRQLADQNLRPGMWVSTPTGVGIVTGVTAPATPGETPKAVVAKVREDGTTSHTDYHEFSEVKQAQAKDIPHARRSHLSDDELNARGYN